MTYISWSSDFALYLEDCLMYEHLTSELWVSMTQHLTSKCRSLWPIFHGPVILSYILKTVWYMNTILWIMSQYDPMFDLKIFVAHCDLYFMVHWFCLISWKLFSGWTTYFGIMCQYDPTYDLQIFVCPYNLYFMVHSICPLSWRLFDVSWRLFDVWTSYFRIMS